MRLIDADALPRYTGYALSADAVAKAVENAPTIEAVEVVRCRDCKCMKMIVKNSLGYKLGIYDGECGMHCLYVMDNDFCKWGERRDDG